MSAPSLQDYSRLVPYPVQKRLLSLLDGYHRGEGAGASQEFLDMAEYKVGDDIADIDWKATARLGHPVVKRFEATAVLRVIIVADTGATMAGTAPDGASKQEIATDLIRALSWLVSSHGDLLGLVAGDRANQKRMPARSGTGHAETILHVAAAATVTGAAADLSALLRLLNEQGQRSLIFVVTDASQVTPDTAGALRRLSLRHELGLFLIDDLDPTVTSGTDVADVEGGPLPEYVQDNPILESQWRIYRRVAAQKVEQLLAGLNLRYVTIARRDQVLPALIEVLGGGKRAA